MSSKYDHHTSHSLGSPVPLVFNVHTAKKRIPEQTGGGLFKKVNMTAAQYLAFLRKNNIGDVEADGALPKFTVEAMLRQGRGEELILTFDKKWFWIDDEIRNALQQNENKQKFNFLKRASLTGDTNTSRIPPEIWDNIKRFM